MLSLFAGRILKKVHEVFALKDLRELIVAEERRDYEDFRELGAYLSIAKRALLAAHIKVGSMYPRTEGRIQDIRRIEDALFEVRGKLDSRWLRDLTEPRPPGPHPIYPGAGNLPEPAKRAIEEIERLEEGHL